MKVSARDHQLESIITSTDKMISYSGDGHDMIRQAKILAEVGGEAKSAEIKFEKLWNEFFLVGSYYGTALYFWINLD